MSKMEGLGWLTALVGKYFKSSQTNNKSERS